MTEASPSSRSPLPRAVTRVLDAMDSLFPGVGERLRSTETARLRSTEMTPLTAGLEQSGPLRYASSCRFQSRGIQPFDAKLTSAGLPTLCALIEDRLSTHGRCKLLEIGCGEGRLLLELLARFGERVELHGINHPEWPMIAGPSPLHRTNEHYQILHPLRLFTLPLPTLHEADAQDLSSFPLRDFDLVISQAVLPHIPDKAAALEQSAMLLSSDGMFVHELDCLDLPDLSEPDADLPRIQIACAGARRSARAHLGEAGIELLRCRRTGVKGPCLLAHYHASDRPLRLGLTLDREGTAPLAQPTGSEDAQRFWGVRSLYALG